MTIKRVGLTGIMLVVLIALLVAGRPTTAQQPARPNIVVLMSDDQDYASLPAMRYLLSFPEGSWVNFTNAFTNDSLCCPARYKTASVYVPPDSPNYLEADVSDKPFYIRRLPIPSQNTINLWRAERLDAQREILAIDDGVLAVVNALKSEGVLDNTLLIYLSDQGYSWLNHRWDYKHCIYDECSQIPLFIRFPGQVGNREENRLVTNVSLASTIAEWAGVTPGLPQDAPSLMPLLRGDAAGWDEVILLEKRAANPPESHFWGVRTPEWLYAEYDHGDRELYDLTADPWQLNNVAGKPGYAAVQAQMAATLAAMKP